MHVIIAADGDRGPGSTKSHARLVREALAPETLREAARIDDGAVIFQSGDPHWHRQLDPITAEPEIAAAPIPDAIPLRTGARTRGFERRSPSGLEGGPAVDLRRVLGIATNRDALDFGTLVHAWLEELEWIETGLPDPDRLRAIARRVVPAMDSGQVDERILWIQERLDAQEVRAALSRERYPEGAVVETELPFLRRDGDGVMEGVIDRLVLTREGERVVRAEILDYKSDSLQSGANAALVARAAHYAPQLRAYARPVAEMYGLAPADVSAALVFLDLGKLVSVDVSAEVVHT